MKLNTIKWAVFTVYRREERPGPNGTEIFDGLCACFVVRSSRESIKVVESFGDGTEITVEHNRYSKWFDSEDEALEEHKSLVDDGIGPA